MHGIFGIGCLAAALTAASIPAFGSTWNEPWHDEVLRTADTFLLAKVVDNRQGRKCELEVLEHLAGDPVDGDVTVQGYHRLVDDPGNGCPLTHGERYYLFLQQDGKRYRMPTPTTGFAFLSPDDQVIATYRHSYHKARVSRQVYEATMPLLFRAVHGLHFDRAALDRFVSEQLSDGPVVPDVAGGPGSEPDADTMAAFFRQHAALESIHFVGGEDHLTRLSPFLQIDNFHFQVAAVRALGGIGTAAAREGLWQFLQGDGDDFANVVAILELGRLGATEHCDRLAEYRSEASDAETGFGGDLMDPRLGTVFPHSVRSAVDDFLAAHCHSG